MKIKKEESIPESPVTIELEDHVPETLIEPIELPEVEIPKDFDI